MAIEQAQTTTPPLRRLTLVLTTLPAGGTFKFQLEQPGGGRIGMSEIRGVRLQPAAQSFTLRYFSLCATGVVMITDKPADMLTLSLHCRNDASVLRGHLYLPEPGRVMVMTETDVQHLFGSSVWMVRTSSFAATGPPAR